MLSIVQGDLMFAKETYLCHQTNCVTKRSAHLSKTVFTFFPHADIYTGRKDHDTPGTIIVRGEWGEPERPVVNMLGQVYPGEVRFPDSKKDGYKARLGYFKKCLSHMLALDDGGMFPDSFAFPWKIGCGAAGGDWEKYLDKLLDFSEAVSGDVVIYKLR